MVTKSENLFLISIITLIIILKLLRLFFDRTSVHSNLFRHKGGSKKKTDEISILKQN